jgi:SAM-dependent methyltransferase
VASRLLALFALWGAVLTFALEPLVGRLLLPLHGGGFQVWTTCLLFFQVALFLGYCYARWIGPAIGRWHLAIVLLPLAFLPIGIDEAPAAGAPTLAVLESLLAQVALPFGVLSTTGVMAQSWLARSKLADRADPYHLYAASNAGSLIGLLGYPFLLEPLLGVRAQTWLWGAGYLLYAGLALAIGASLPSSLRGTPPLEPARAPAPRRAQVGWFLLSAAPVILLMAVTNAIAIQAGSLPMFWVLPLGLYLLTFILAFGRRGAAAGYARILGLSLLALLPALCLPAWRGLALYLFAMFHLALANHAELHRRRPSAGELGSFYFALALGGLAGGVFVGLVAPACFPALYELGVGFSLALGSLVVARRRELRAWLEAQAPLGWIRRRESRALRLVAASALAALTGLSLAASWSAVVAISRVQGRFAHRNFYGIYAIREGELGEVGMPGSTGPGPVRVLIHGRTVHGFEVLAPGGERLATGYYQADAPYGDVFRVLPSPKTVGVMGLGAGAMAAHFEAGDELVFYELDPDNERIARDHFGYLRGCPARVRVVVGDARLELARDAAAPGAYYDALLMDAFSGDGIPSHLLTLEAIRGYLAKLKPGGLLVFHVSNRYYELGPVLRAASRSLGLHGLYRDSSRGGELSAYELPSVVYVLAEERAALAPLAQRGWLDPEPRRDLPDARPWTDDYVNPLLPLYARLSDRLRPPTAR